VQGAERKRGAERRGARRSRFPRWKDRLPGCDAGRGTQNEARNAGVARDEGVRNAAWNASAMRGGVGSPSEELPSGGLGMRGRRKRGT
jgi:hypothetical protein